MKIPPGFADRIAQLSPTARAIFDDACAMVDEATADKSIDPRDKTMRFAPPPAFQVSSPTPRAATRPETPRARAHQHDVLNAAPRRAHTRTGK